MESSVPRLIEDLMNEQYTYFYRTRAMFEFEQPKLGAVTNKLCLNEVFAAEKDVSCTSMYKLVVDGKDMGKFKSSGIIVSHNFHFLTDWFTGVYWDWILRVVVLGQTNNTQRRTNRARPHGRRELKRTCKRFNSDS